MATERSPSRATSLASIIAFHVDGQNEESRELGHGILGLIASRYGLKPPEPGDFTLMFSLEGFEYSTKLIKRETCNVFIIAVSRSSESSRGWKEDLSAYQDHIRPLLKLLPDNPTAVFSTYSVYTGSRDKALVIFNEYLAHQTQRQIGLGIIRGCLLAMLGDSQQTKETQVVERALLLSPFDSADAEAVDSELLDDIGYLASIEGEINKLYQMRQPFFRLIGSAEDDTQRAVDEIIRKRFGGAVKLEDMEESLKVITGRFSTLSMLAGAVRRDNIVVGHQLDEVEGLLQRWNESEVEGYPTIFSVEMMHYRALSKPFKDFADRIESLRGELGTVLDTVRTYLSVEQQKLSVEEQKSSKDLLVRLVNLQEILHKLEILVVAFYMTEMASLVFQALAHDIALVLTAAFIPLALLVAVGISRLLHRP
jgi:hypothetical protein